VLDEKKVIKMQIKPVLVLTGRNDIQKQTFFNAVKVGQSYDTFFLGGLGVFAVRFFLKFLLK